MPAKYYMHGAKKEFFIIHLTYHFLCKKVAPWWWHGFQKKSQAGIPRKNMIIAITQAEFVFGENGNWKS